MEKTKLLTDLKTKLKYQKKKKKNKTMESFISVTKKHSRYLHRVQQNLIIIKGLGLAVCEWHNNMKVVCLRLVTGDGVWECGGSMGGRFMGVDEFWVCSNRSKR